ncbi:uncharacterized protein LOC110689284 [Chenopodium quinoa]|uniref:uncharacterized protein LOC110689284 n=1 Tax=Chenopodium quinoa TaxID=63459 RepID=UPI000B78AEAF|nr:uncharacterized protein LOC110689284 [Chenopodium quinoa]
MQRLLEKGLNGTRLGRYWSWNYRQLMKKTFLSGIIIPWDNNRDFSFYKLIWKLNIPSKWSLFLWKLCRNGVAVKHNLIQRGVEIDGGCDSCGMEKEDIQHIFRLCSFARYSWNNCSLHINSEMDGSTPLGHWIQSHILLFHSEDGKHSSRIHVFVGTLWSLWLTRNGRVFRNEGGYLDDFYRHYNQSMKTLVSFLTPKVRSREALQLSDNGGGQPPGFRRFNIGRCGTLLETPMGESSQVVIMVDGSWMKSTGHAGFGWAYSSNAEDFQEGGGDFGTALSALHAELLACLKAIR